MISTKTMQVGDILFNEKETKKFKKRLATLKSEDY